jgi:hypothetical protein
MMDQPCVIPLPNICSSFFSSDFSSLERASKRLLASGLGHRSNNNDNDNNDSGGKKKVNRLHIHCFPSIYRYG